MQDLVQHLFRKLVSAYAERAREVLDPRGMGDLSAESGFLDHKHAFAVTERVKRCGHTCRPSADYNDIVHFISLN